MKSLAFAIAAVSGLFAGTASWGMEAVTDTDLSEAVAQSGVTVVIVPPTFNGAGPGTDVGVSIGQAILFDSNGFAGSTAPGAIVFGTSTATDFFAFTMLAGSRIVINLDATGNVGGGATDRPSRNVNISVPAFNLKLPAIYAAKSNGPTSAPSSLTPAILNPMQMSSGAFNMNLQYGFQGQGHFGVIRSTLTGGVTLTGFSLNDVNSGGSVAFTSANFNDSGAGADLQVKLGVDIATTGIVASVMQLGDAANGMDINIAGFRLGNAAAPAIGGVDVLGLKLANTTVSISGHN